MSQRARQQLSRFIAAKRKTDDRNARRRTSVEQAACAPVAVHFSPARHGLSPEDCHRANALLRRAEQQRPLRGDSQQRRFRHAMRCAGIVSALKRQAIGSAHFGYALHAHRGGNTMRDHGLHILRANAPRGYAAAQRAKERRAAEAYYETHGEPLVIGAQPAATPEQQRIRHLEELWEAHEWQQQRDRLQW